MCNLLMLVLGPWLGANDILCDLYFVWRYQKYRSSCVSLVAVDLLSSPTTHAY